MGFAQERSAFYKRQAMICIVDSGIGNLRSVYKAVEHLGFRAKITSNSRDIKKAAKLILPGVGEFGSAVKGLKAKGVLPAVKKHIFSGKPFLGICLGYHLLFEASDESKKTKGLGIFKGRVKRFPAGLIVPHMGWNAVKVKNSNPGRIIFSGIKNKSFFYFAHSFYPAVEDKNIVLGVTSYGGDFASAVAKGNIYGVQFHPEKSQALGLKVLGNFLKL